MTIHDKHKQWLRDRGLDPEVAEKLGMFSTRREDKAWLAIPYVEQGEVVNHKYRLTSEKDHRMDTGAPLSLWNADCLKDSRVRNGQVPVVITEGEMDGIAVYQCGITNVVSVPNGAPAKQTEDLDTAKRYEWVDRHAADLREVGQFIIAVDDDEAGHNLRQDLVALLGADRCKFIDYPFPHKDLNEVLQHEGQEAVVKCIATARPFPVQGIYRIDDFPERAQVRNYRTGIDALDDMMAIVPGTLTVLTGYANMGKSSLMNSIIAHNMAFNFPVCVASFETDVRPILANGIMGALLHCNPKKVGIHPKYQDGLDCMRERLLIISQTVDEDMEMDLDKFLDLCRIAVVRDGVKMIVMDPWNELEHKRRRDETETDYIGRAIRAIKRFAKQYDVAFWVVAHPTKPQPGVSKVPTLYDISGSANWANKADYGVTYHRPNPQENKATVRVSKVRMGLPGMRAELDLKFDFETSQFVPYC